MIYTINDLPPEARPRERLLRYGAKALADYELLAIILRTGTKNKSVLDLSRELLVKARNIGSLNNITAAELKEISGIGTAKAITVLASIELGSRVCGYDAKKEIIRSSDDLYRYIRYDLENLPHEEIRVCYLDVKGHIIDCKVLCIGNANSSGCDEREIVKWALKLSSYNIILVHNHPSGDSTPSKNDLLFTERLSKFCFELDIRLLEHLIIGKNNYFRVLANRLVRSVNNKTCNKTCERKEKEV